MAEHDEELFKLKGEIAELVDLIITYVDRNDYPIYQDVILEGLRGAKKYLEDTIGILDEYLEELTPEKLASLATLASELDKTGDPVLVRQASVLDEILLTIGASKSQVAALKAAQDEEIKKIKAQAESKLEDPYVIAKQLLDKYNNIDEAKKALNGIKTYRPMEAPLNTRTCPDHPGAQMSRVSEGTYQCSLDKGIYNYYGGYTTLNGNHVPGGTVSNQTQSLFDRPNEFTSFETREGKLNSLKG